MKIYSRKFQSLPKVILFSLFLGATFMGKAQTNAADSTGVAERKEFKQAINFCPIALVLGIYSVNYERMFGDHHALMLRADYESIPKRYTAANIDINGKAAIVNYRYHVKGGLNSCFVGTFARYRMYEGDGNTNDTAFDFTLSEVTVGANVGRRWVFKNGLNFTLSFGWGFFMDKIDSDNADSDAMKYIRKFQDEYDLYNGMFGEVSVGYAF